MDGKNNEREYLNPAYTLSDLTFYFLKLGTFGFGVPIALGFVYSDDDHYGFHRKRGILAFYVDGLYLHGDNSSAGMDA